MTGEIERFPRPIRAGAVLRVVGEREQGNRSLRLRLFVDLAGGERVVAGDDLDSPLLALSPHVSAVRAQFPSTISQSDASRLLADGVRNVMDRVTAERVATELTGGLSASDLDPFKQRVARLLEALGPGRWESLLPALALRGITVSEDDLERLPFAVELDVQ